MRELTSCTLHIRDYFVQLLSVEELKKLVESEDQLDGLVDSLGVFKSGDETRNNLYGVVQNLAEQNVAQKSEFEALQKEIADLRTQEKEKRDELTELLGQQQAILKVSASLFYLRFFFAFFFFLH